MFGLFSQIFCYNRILQKLQQERKTKMTKEQIETRLAKMGIEKDIVVEMDEDDYKDWTSKFLKAQKT